MVPRVALCAVLMAGWCAAASAATLPFSEDVPVVGGTVALARSLGLAQVPDPPRFAAELARIIYNTPEGKSASTDALLKKLSAHLEMVGRLQASPAAAQPGNGGTATEAVPIALPAAVWSTAVFRRPVALSQLFAAIIGDRRAALLCHGLAALDAPTLQFLTDHADIVARLYERDAPVFAAFGDALRIHDGRVVTPGGGDGASIWEAAVEEKTTRPDRFVRELFERHDGRLAYLYDVVAHLDAPRARFALGLWIQDPVARAERFKALVSTISGYDRHWEIAARPFVRPSDDVARLLAEIAVEDSGAPSPPAARALWSRAFDGASAGEGVVDAAWLAAAMGDSPDRRAERLDQLAFGQRVFKTVPAADLGDALIAIRALVRYRMLMLTLERIGVRSPAVYAAAARQAERLSSLNAKRAYVALSQFQGALALVARLARVRAIDSARAEALVQTLVAVPLDADGRYAGGIGRWLASSIARALGGSGDVDARLAVALAGARPGNDAPAIVWEGREYRVDFATAEQRRLTIVRARLGGSSLALALELDHLCDQLTTSPSLDAIRAVTSELQAAAAAMPTAQGRASASLPRGFEPKRAREILDRAIRDLSRLSTPADAEKAAGIAGPLVSLADDLLADALATWAYALDVGDPDAAPLLAGDVVRRHDFGFLERDREQRLRTPWREPAPDVSPGVPWHVKGSLLGLDLAMAQLALRRTTSDPVAHPPVLTGPQRATFAKTVALMNPLTLDDADRDAIAGAIQRGRDRIAGLARDGSNLDGVADAIAMDGWRRRAVLWALDAAPDRVASYFSLADLLVLGGGAPVSFDAWGTDAGPSIGCLCTEMPLPGRWPLFVGRISSGCLPTQVVDLNLRVALALHDRQLPAALAKPVLASAMQDFIDDVQPADDNDWLTLVRWSGSVTPERIDDYIAALTAGGPLVPVS